MAQRIALAIGAHPDDIEFKMAGTLLMLREAGWETHYWNLSEGNCGSERHGAVETARIRRRESKEAARILEAVWHAPIARDLEIMYEVEAVRRVAAVVREVAPSVILTHPPVDYMEDHTETCRLVVTAAFAHGMPNFRTIPRRKPYVGDVVVYHCMPHGLCDPLRREVRPSCFLDTTAFQGTMRKAQLAHASQFEWLKKSQGMKSMVEAIAADSLEVGRRSGKFLHAEGWWRHAHTGFCGSVADPIRETAGKRYLEG